jgi:hypothetical protein
MSKYSAIVVLFFLGLFSCQSSTASKDEYIIVWKYNVKRDYISQFEKEYGTNGTWMKLFEASTDYHGSFLHKSDDEENTYLLIDHWTSKETYEKFKEKNRSKYDSLSIKFEPLYEQEKKIGSFFSLP